MSGLEGQRVTWAEADESHTTVGNRILLDAIAKARAQAQDIDGDPDAVAMCRAYGIELEPWQVRFLEHYGDPKAMPPAITLSRARGGYAPASIITDEIGELP